MIQNSLTEHKLQRKIGKLLCINFGNLAAPVFSPETLAQIRNLINEITEFRRRGLLMRDRDKLFLEFVELRLPELLRLVQNNFLDETVTELQEKVSLFVSRLNESAETWPDENKEQIGSFILQFHQITPTILVLSANRVPAAAFSRVQLLVRNVSELAQTIISDAHSPVLEHVDVLIKYGPEIMALIDNILAARSLISVCDSIRMLTDNDNLRMSSETVLKPKRPNVQSAGRWYTALEKALATHTDQEGFAAVLQKGLNGLETLVAPLDACHLFLLAVAQIKAPGDVKTKLFHKCWSFLAAIFVCFLKYNQLNDLISGLDQTVNDFSRAVKCLDTEIDLLAKSSKKPNGWATEKSKAVTKRFEEFTETAKEICKTAGFVDVANKHAKETLYQFNVSRFKLPTVELHLQPTKHIRELELPTILRAINRHSMAVIDLEKRGVSIIDHEKISVWHIPSLRVQIDDIAGLMIRVDNEFVDFCFPFTDEFPSWKSGVAMRSLFADTTGSFEDSILHMERLPIRIMSLRLKAFMMYKVGFPVNSDEKMLAVVRIWLLLLNIYIIYAKLEADGGCCLSTLAQLTYLATECDCLTTSHPVFAEYKNYFTGIDIFRINNDDLFSHILSLRETVKQELDKWSWEGMISVLGSFSADIDLIIDLLQQIKAIDSFRSLSCVSKWIKGISVPEDKIDNMSAFATDIGILSNALPVFLAQVGQRPSKNTSASLAKLSQVSREVQLRIRNHLRLRQMWIHLNYILMPVEQSKYAHVDGQLRMEPNEQIRSELTTLIQNYSSRCQQSPAEALQCTTIWEENASMILVYNHCRNIVTCYSDRFAEQTIQTELKRRFSELFTDSEQSAMTDDAAADVLRAVRSSFVSFAMDIQSCLHGELDAVSQELIAAMKTNKESSASRATMRERDLAKQLSLIRQGLSDPSFSICSRLFEFFRTDRPTIASKQRKLVSFCKELYLLFMCNRCCEFRETRSISYIPDLHFLHYLVSRLLKHCPQVSHNWSCVIHQLDDMITCGIDRDMAFLSTLIRLIKESQSIIDIAPWIDSCGPEFFDFESFLRSIPEKMCTCETLLSSRLVELAQKIRNTLLQVLCGKTSKSRECITLLKAFMRELSRANFPIDETSIHVSIQSLRHLQSIVDIATVCESLDAFLRHTGHPISGIDLLKLHITTRELDEKLRRLLHIPKFVDLYASFDAVYKEIMSLPCQFGLVNIDDAQKDRISDEWAIFMSSYEKIEVDTEKDALKSLISAVIQDIIGTRESFRNEMRFLEFWSLSYRLSNSESFLFKLQLTLLYLESKLENHHNLQLERLHETINTLISWEQTRIIVPELEALMINLFHIERKQNENTAQSLPLIPVFDSRQEELPFDHTELGLSEQTDLDFDQQTELSFDQQTEVCEIIHAYVLANQIENERVAEIPLLQMDIDDIENSIKSIAEQNSQLKRLNEMLSGIVCDIPMDTNTTHSLKQVSNDIDDVSNLRKKHEKNAQIEELSKMSADQLLNQIDEINKANFELSTKIRQNRQKAVLEKSHLAIERAEEMSRLLAAVSNTTKAAEHILSVVEKGDKVQTVQTQGVHPVIEVGSSNIDAAIRSISNDTRNPEADMEPYFSSHNADAKIRQLLRILLE